MGNTEQEYLSIKEAAYRWHLLFEDGVATEDDHEAFKRWLSEDTRHRDAYDRATVAWDAFDGLRGHDLGINRLSGLATQDDFAKPKQSLYASLLNPSMHWIKFGMSTAAAVVCIVIIVNLDRVRSAPIPASTPPIVSIFETARGQTHTVSLSDGTNVTLGPLTLIKVSISTERRDIAIEGGAAVFDVTQDSKRPFSVTADAVVATALGTVFEVRSNGGVVRIAVEEGEVGIARPLIIAGQTTGSITRKSIQAGENGIVAVSQGTAQYGTFRAEEFASWRQARLNYDSATLSEVIDEANRYSDRQILIEGDSEALIGLTMTGFFNTEDIDQLLSTLSAVFPVDVLDEEHTKPIVVRIR